jgi:hypothetical protein
MFACGGENTNNKDDSSADNIKEETTTESQNSIKAVEHFPNQNLQSR